MASLDRSFQPIVKDASGVLVGVAQVRIGQPSLRAATTVTQATTLTAVGNSNKVVSTTVASEIVIAPVAPSVANTGTAANLAGATGYTGKIDGAFIFRAVATATAGKVAENASTATADKVEVFNPYGKLIHTTTSLAAFGTMSANLGMTFSAATFTGATVGDTWVLPVYATGAQSRPQTSIICPFSTLTATDSIGGLKSASFQPKIDGVKKLESGFPSYVADQVIDKVSVDIGWSGYEYTNAKLILLRNMIGRVINTGNLAAISVEMIMRTRGGSPVRMWIPTATFTSLPTYAPTNDYSDVAFQLSALKQTEITPNTVAGGTDANNSAGVDVLTAAEVITYNAWLNDAPLYSELSY